MIRNKSIFLKLLSTFLIILIILFFIITATISVIVNNYGTSVKKDSLSSAANSAALFIRNNYNVNECTDFEVYIRENEKDISGIINLLCANDETMFMFVTNSEGRLIRHGGADGDDFYGYEDRRPRSVSRDVQLSLAQGTHVSETNDMEGLFGSELIYYGIPLFDDGEYAGAVFACSDSTGTDSLISAMTRTVTLAVLWIMLASLVAVYFITDRITAPLKSMSRAAKSFANGSFDARVEVIGNDEVSELARAFNNMATSLSNLEEMRRSFLANVSHDLRTPMTTISGFIDGIIDGAIPPEQHEYYLGIIASEVRRLSRLVSQLLDISRIEAGERKFTPEVFDICEQGREIIIGNIQRLEEKKLDVSFECDQDNMLVLADKDAIHQIFYNICDNAIKFSKEGGRYEISVRARDSLTYVSVYNEGQGISEEDLPFVFERFYKSDKSRGRDKVGVGLGMYISRTIIEAHSQRIWAESEAGSWCRFTFTLESVKGKDKK